MTSHFTAAEITATTRSLVRVKISSQAMSDMDDPQKYIFKRWDYRRVPRWENDGIDEQKREIEMNDRPPSFEPPTDAEKQLAGPIVRDLAELLGDWVYAAGSENGVPIPITLPAFIVQVTANEQLNLTEAQNHLLSNRKDSKIAQILEDIGYKQAISKASKDPRRFPEWRSLMAPILQRNWGTDRNMNLMFGDVASVRGVLIEVGIILADPPPYGSPAYAIWNPILQQKGKARVKPVCGFCQKEEEGKKPLLHCSRCDAIKYCCRDCQVADWPVHKPDCLEQQGQPVPEAVRQKAVDTLAKWAREKEQEKQEKQEEVMLNLQILLYAYRSEGRELLRTYSHDCNGARFLMDIPSAQAENLLNLVAGTLADLAIERNVEPLAAPEGIPEWRDSSFHGLLCHTKSTKAKILIMYDRLFHDRGNGSQSGITIRGIFVVDRVKHERGEDTAVWTEIAEDAMGNFDNRCQRLVLRLEIAKSQSKYVPEEVSLGFFDCKESFDRSHYVRTEFGLYREGRP